MHVLDVALATWTFTQLSHVAASALRPSTRLRRGIKRRATKALVISPTPESTTTAIWTSAINTRFERWVAQRAHGVDMVVLCLRMLAMPMLLHCTHAEALPLVAWLPLLCTLLLVLLAAATIPAAYQRHRWWLLPSSCVAAGACSMLLLAPLLLNAEDHSRAATLVWVVGLETALSNALLTVCLGGKLCYLHSFRSGIKTIITPFTDAVDDVSGGAILLHCHGTAHDAMDLCVHGCAGVHASVCVAAGPWVERWRHACHECTNRVHHSPCVCHAVCIP